MFCVARPSTASAIQYTLREQCAPSEANISLGAVKESNSLDYKSFGSFKLFEETYHATQSKRCLAG